MMFYIPLARLEEKGRRRTWFSYYALHLLRGDDHDPVVVIVVEGGGGLAEVRIGDQVDGLSLATVAVASRLFSVRRRGERDRS